PATVTGVRTRALPISDDDDSSPFYVAHLALTFPASPMDQIMGKKPAEPLRVTARRRDKQYVEITRAVVSRKFLVRGRLWALNELLQGIELNDALLFEDTDWLSWSGVSTPADVAACPICVNEMVDVARPPAFQHDKKY